MDSSPLCRAPRPPEKVTCPIFYIFFNIYYSYDHFDPFFTIFRPFDIFLPTLNTFWSIYIRCDIFWPFSSIFAHFGSTIKLEVGQLLREAALIIYSHLSILRGGGMHFFGGALRGACTFLVCLKGGADHFLSYKGRTSLLFHL